MSRLATRAELLGSVYQAVEARRSSTDQMMWQAPALSLTAQAFLLTVGLERGTAGVGRLIAGALGLVVALASVQLLAKHRHHELQLSRWLQALEARTGLPALNHPAERAGLATGARSLRRGLTDDLSDHVLHWLCDRGEKGSRQSFKWWLWTLTAFAAADAILIVMAALTLAGAWAPLDG